MRISEGQIGGQKKGHGRADSPTANTSIMRRCRVELPTPASCVDAVSSCQHQHHVSSCQSSGPIPPFAPCGLMLLFQRKYAIPRVLSTSIRIYGGSIPILQLLGAGLSPKLTLFHLPVLRQSCCGMIRSPCHPLCRRKNSGSPPLWGQGLSHPVCRPSHSHSHSLCPSHSRCARSPPLQGRCRVDYMFQHRAEACKPVS